MTFEIEINGRLRAVTIEAVGAAGPAGGRFKVAVRDMAEGTSNFELRTSNFIDVRTTDLGMSLLFEDGRVVDVATTAQAPGEWLLQLPHVDLIAVVDRRRRERGHPGAAAAAGEQRINAPMPGRVVRILVKPGDEVALRQGLIVVEAMKMENELTSPKAGRVKEVAVTEGTSVEAGRLLIVVE
jgi:biotin carboxyl carrier protein